MAWRTLLLDKQNLKQPLGICQRTVILIRSPERTVGCSMLSSARKSLLKGFLKQEINLLFISFSSVTAPDQLKRRFYLTKKSDYLLFTFFIGQAKSSNKLLHKKLVKSTSRPMFLASLFLSAFQKDANICSSLKKQNVNVDQHRQFVRIIFTNIWS